MYRKCTELHIVYILNVCHAHEPNFAQSTTHTQKNVIYISLEAKSTVPLEQCHFYWAKISTIRICQNENMPFKWHYVLYVCKYECVRGMYISLVWEIYEVLFVYVSWRKWKWPKMYSGVPGFEWIYSQRIPPEKKPKKIIFRVIWRRLKIVHIWALRWELHWALPSLFGIVHA